MLVYIHAGYTIPKGWKVIVWIRSLHVDPAHYDNPLSFNPDRWDVSYWFETTYYIYVSTPNMQC